MAQYSFQVLKGFSSWTVTALQGSVIPLKTLRHKRLNGLLQPIQLLVMLACRQSLWFHCDRDPTRGALHMRTSSQPGRCRYWPNISDSQVLALRTQWKFIPRCVPSGHPSSALTMSCSFLLFHLCIEIWL